MSNIEDMARWLEREGANCQKHCDAAMMLRKLEAELNRAESERDALRAELEALKAQKPVAWQLIDPETKERIWNEDSFSGYPNDLDDCVPLFLATKAKP